MRDKITKYIDPDMMITILVDLEGLTRGEVKRIVTFITSSGGRIMRGKDKNLIRAIYKFEVIDEYEVDEFKELLGEESGKKCYYTIKDKSICYRFI